MSLPDMYQYLLDSGAPMNLLRSPPVVDSSMLPPPGLQPSNPLTQPMILAAIRSCVSRMAQCDFCGLRGHTSDICGFRGSNFQPSDLQNFVAQFNTLHGEKPKVPLTEKWWDIPPKARIPSKSSSTPNINVMENLDLPDHDLLPLIPDIDIPGMACQYSF